MDLLHCVSQLDPAHRPCLLLQLDCASATPLTPELIDPKHVRHIVVSPRYRAQRTAHLLFENAQPPDCAWTTDPDVSEWDYGAYEGMLTKDIRKEHPGWEIWKDG